MISPQMISDSIPPVYLTDTAQRVLDLMKEYYVTELPVLDGEKYNGLITLEEALLLKDNKKALKSFKLNLNKPYVLQTAHLFDIIRAAVEYNVRIMPVVDEDFNYWGVISAQSCLRSFATLNSVAVPGAVLEMETDIKNFTLSELARIADDHDVKILCFYTDINQTNNTVEITVKTNTTDIAGLISSLERFEYTIRNIYNENEYTDAVKHRYDALMRYLNT